MDPLIKTEFVAQPQIGESEGQHSNSSQGQQQASNPPGRGSPSAAAPPPKVSYLQWAPVQQTNRLVDDAPISPSGSSSSSGATHISAGSALESRHAALPTPAATVQSDNEKPPTSSSSAQQPEQRSAASATQGPAPPEQTPYNLPASHPITFPANRTPPSASLPTPQPSGNVPPPSIIRLKGKEDPLPPHLRAMLEEFYRSNPTPEPPPCALASDNRHSIYIFPGGKRAKYVDRQGLEVRYIRAQLPENGQWVSIVDSPSQPPAFVKRLPKHGSSSSSMPGTSLFIWEGVRGFQKEPSFFKVLADETEAATGHNRALAPATTSSRPAKKPRLLSEPSTAPMLPTATQSLANASGLFSTLPPTPSQTYSSSTTIPPYYGRENSRVSATPTPSRTNYTSYTNLPRPDLNPPESNHQHRFSNHMYSGPTSYEGFNVNYSHPKNSAPNSATPAPPQRSESTPAPPQQQAQQVQAPPGILSPDEKARTQIFFVGGSRARTRPFTTCDTIEKFFVQAAAAGFKNFSLNAATFVMVKLRARGQNDETVQEVAVVKGDEIDFQQLQEVIREVGNWEDLRGGCECEVSTVD